MAILTEYSWRPGTPFANANAQKVGEELLEIGGDFSEGGISAEDIVEKASDESTELHKCFDWDDTTAAHKYRLHTARIITSAIVFKRTEEQINEGKAPQRVLVMPEHRSEGYKPVSIVVKKEDEYQKLLQQALRELHAFKVKYAMLTDLDYILELIE